MIARQEHLSQDSDVDRLYHGFTRMGGEGEKETTLLTLAIKCFWGCVRSPFLSRRAPLYPKTELNLLWLSHQENLHIYLLFSLFLFPTEKFLVFFKKFSVLVKTFVIFAKSFQYYQFVEKRK